jgi:hypothetical protein
MTFVRPTLAWIAAAVASAAFGAAATVGLVIAKGFFEWPFLGWVWLALTAVGAVIALVAGAVAAPLAIAAARFVRPPRPAADIVVGACAAFAVLMGVRAFVFARSGDPVGPPDLGPILVVPFLAGALAGYVYWRLAQRR